MSRAEAAAWWTEVEELRERIERRRMQQAAVPTSERRASRAVVSAEPEWRTEPPHSDSTADPVSGPRRQRSAAPPPVAPARRTVRIRGQAIPTVVAPRLRPVEAPGELDSSPAEAHPTVRSRPYGTARPSRPRPRPAERMGANPDRLAAWAFALALLTLLVAAISAHGL